jgi:AraC-like DNA-binding protein
MEGMNYISLFKVDRYNYKSTRHHECASGYPFIGIGLMEAGQAVFTSHNGARIELKAGDAIYIPKGQIYHSDWTGSPDISFYSISFDYAQQHTAAHYYPLQKFACTKELFDAAREMHTMLRRDPDDAYRALGKFYSLYPSVKAALSTARHNTSYLEIMQAVSYIKQNCTADFSVGTLAKMCSMSESKFYAAFKAGTGHSPTEYKNHIRIMRAEQMLAQNSCSIEYICEQLNFCSPAYFRRVFKQHTGQLPSQVKTRSSSI